MKIEPHSLADDLREISQGSQLGRVAVVGVGNELNADDAAGVLVARELMKITGDRDLSHKAQPPALLILEAGLAPEAFTGPLRRFQPDLVLVVDAAELGEAPGALRWVDWSEGVGLSASTHSLPPSVLAQYLVSELGCRVILVGIQPKQLDFDQGVSAEVRQAVSRVAQEVIAGLFPSI